jgi:hypothetical protein
VLRATGRSILLFLENDSHLEKKSTFLVCFLAFRVCSFVYWIAPWMAAILASVIYVIYAGGTVFGAKLPIGPFKSQTAPAATTTKKKKN